MFVKAFISSTCYDLIDLRAELEAELRGLGIGPMLSDRPSSEFTVDPYRNSIDTCLANVRECDVFIIILSRRDGPPLGRFGYKDVSATHLEYLEAVKAKKPIYMYVRDRLDGAFSVWRQLKRGKAKLPEEISGWINKNDYPIFDLIKKHGQLTKRTRRATAKTAQNNWIATFRNSCDLKRMIAFDLRKHFLQGLIEGLTKRKQLPLLVPEVMQAKIDVKEMSMNLEMTIMNVGFSAAIHPYIKILGAKTPPLIKCLTLLPNAKNQICLRLELDEQAFKEKNPVFRLQCCYTTSEGLYMCDSTRIELYWDDPENVGPPVCKLEEKTLINDRSFEIGLSGDSPGLA